ncbi:MAG: nitroreductase [candidate division Zixibacteria bacterium HGW-Zixibacteria-1]|nr:MAG: nitroreductase [candidate division Zixibacteria bacterium HGW-Zixibacteria-1]
MKLYDDKGKHVENNRNPEYVIDQLFINRWSPRAYDPTPVDDRVLMSLFEAARWSMSCFNEQPWLFMYATDKNDLELYLSLLTEGNQKWAVKAPVLGFIFARRRFSHNDKPNAWAAFDSGAAWMAMTMQARMLGLYTHGMGGFHRDKVYDALGVSESDYEVMCAFAAGRYGDREALPEDIKAREKISDRKPLKDMVIKGKR